MSAYFPLFLSLLLIVIFLATVSQVMMRFAFKDKMKERFDYLCDFPYEGFTLRSSWGRDAIMLLIASGLALGFSFSFPLFTKATLVFVGGRDILVSVSGALLAVNMVILCFTDTYNMRRHLMTFVFFAMLEMLTGMLLGFMFLDFKDSHGGLALTFATISFGLALCGVSHRNRGNE